MRLYASLLPIVCLLVAACMMHPAPIAPVKKNRYYYEARGEIIWEVPTEKKIIALTFDDGPDLIDTPQILDLLRQYGVKATFFVIGERVQKYPEIAKREALEGHEVANHTFSHKYFTTKMSVKKLQEEIEKAELEIIDSTGEKPSIFRPPGGFYNERIVEASRKAGYKFVLWSWHQDTKDWDTPGVSKIVDKVLNNARNGDIILFHDHVRGKTQTIDALMQILPELKKRGYQFVTISELLTHQKPAKKIDKH